MEPDLSRCSGCEFPIREKDEVTIIVTGKVVAHCIKYLTFDLFHGPCWKQHKDSPLEVPHEAPPDRSPPSP